MKKQIKRFVLSVLVLTMVFSCIPATTYAKEQFKWSKSIVLSGKMYKDKYGDIRGYDVTIFSDRYTEVTVQNYNGCVCAYSDSSENSNRRYTAEDKYFTPYYGYVVIKDESDVQKNGNATIELDRGWNYLTIRPCSNTTYKKGQEYKCKLTVKDANILFIASDKEVNVDNNSAPLFSKKKFAAFKKWWNPQYKSLRDWERYGEEISHIIAEDMKIAGITNKKVKVLSKEIQQYVDARVQKSKTKGSKILSYKKVVQEYVDSIDGFEEKLCAVGDLSDCDSYFVSYDDGTACWNWLQSEINGMY